MKKKIWIEWVGLWGSGKTTCINSLLDSFESAESKHLSTKDFTLKSRSEKIYDLSISSPSCLISSTKLFFLLLPFFIRAYFKKDTIIIHQFRSFLTCYLARLASNNQPVIENILWEGEMHLLPNLDLNRRAMNKAVDLLFELNKKRASAIVIMRVDEDIAFQRILGDEESGTNIRFEEDQEFTIERLKKSKSSQEQLIGILRAKGIKIFESDGNIQKLKKFIRLI